jgi:hypothetical protein
MKFHHFPHFISMRKQRHFPMFFLTANSQLRSANGQFLKVCDKARGRAQKAWCLTDFRILFAGVLATERAVKFLYSKFFL